MQEHYKFHPKVIFRTPYLAFNPKEISKEKIQQLLLEKWFQEAIYLASPDLHRMSMEWIAGGCFETRKEEKLLASLTKYYSRMMSRCTPYGLFAACSVADWHTDNDISIDEHDIIRHTRLDMHFSCALAFELIKNPAIRHHLQYFPNSSIYQIGNEIRFVEYQYINGRRVHQISAITHTEYIQKVLDLVQNGCSFRALVEAIIDDEITEEEALSFIDELIHSQLLVHELEPAITGGDFTQQIIRVITKIYEQTHHEGLHKCVEYLKEIACLLKKLDQNKTNKIADYQEIIEKVKLFGVDFEENKLFQTDTFRPSNKIRLDEKWQKSLQKAVCLLNRLHIAHQNKNLKHFATKFQERYENQEVVLLEALDTETGIGYLENNSNAGDAPLIEDLQLPDNKEDNSNNWSKIEKWFFEKLKIATEKHLYSIEITDDDLAAFPEANWDDLPASLPVIFRLIDDQNLYIESVGGSSGINLLGRFAYADKEILAITTEIAETEQKLNPDVIFAEIIHLPESRTGNILLHPAFRAYEIPFLAKSSLPTDNQIPLDDLYISVKDQTIVLRSKKLNKIVVPRLSNAHNYSYNALPIYQFLCDLQQQHKRTNFGFSWGNIAKEFGFLPQISYKNIILEAATWNLTKAELTEAIQQKEFRKRMKVLVDGDNELLVDFGNELSLASFQDTIKSRENFVLKDFLYDSSSSITQNTKKQSFTNQFIALLIRQKQAYGGIDEAYKNEEIRRNFSLGSEWLYFKLYGGVKAADKVLFEYIKPLIGLLFEKNLIDYWFFIRYIDPDNHLRIRFHLKDTSKVGEVITLLHKALTPAEEAKYIWKIQADTYQRELERYGFENIALAEKLFFYDSEAILDFLEATEGDAREQVRWLWGLKAIDVFLDNFGLDLSKKMELLRKMKESFAKEFKMDLSLKKQLDKKYRENRAEIDAFLCLDLNEDIIQILYKNHSNIICATSQINESFKKPLLAQNFDYLLSSFIHMTLNRLVPVNQRLHEFVSYDFLFRYYESQIGRQRAATQHKKEKVLELL